MFGTEAKELATAFIPIAVLSASLLGSLHCLGMCGGLAVAVARSRKTAVYYHVGRLLGYIGLGALAGFLGETIFSSKLQGAIPWVAALGLGSIFVFAGIRLWLDKPLHFTLPPILERSALSILNSVTPDPFLTGFFSVLLPCGWLHSFVLGALATRNPVSGAVFLALFWAGTLPAMTAAPWIIQRILKPVAIRAPKAAGAILIFAGLAAFSYKIVPLARAHYGTQAGCHCHHSK
ncbi:MAG: hypothetical protein A2603_07435 [Bdellovibrionales bacterium RIFOXYD1_FULL_55_31]|nr:MAG: hypothetical protein A2603_07435 [Bdellovibrionales bacterium RIFOXYD1_FULL_55_31]